MSTREIVIETAWLQLLQIIHDTAGSAALNDPDGEVEGFAEQIHIEYIRAINSQESNALEAFEARSLAIIELTRLRAIKDQHMVLLNSISVGINILRSIIYLL